MNKMKFGIQLYSVREEIKKDGLDTVLQAIKDAGFDFVELAGFYGLTPTEAKAKFAEYGLDPLSAHIGIDGAESSLPYIDMLGIKNIFIPWATTEDIKNGKVAEDIKRIQPMLKERGITLGYHNHAHEYENGEDMVYDLITAVPDFFAELDVFWATAAGLDPVAVMEKYGDKLAFLHIKEMDKRTTDNPTEFPNVIVGEGKVGMDRVFAKAVKMGVEYAVLEVEGFSCPYPEYLEKSLRAMKALAK